MGKRKLTYATLKTQKYGFKLEPDLSEMLSPHMLYALGIQLVQVMAEKTLNFNYLIYIYIYYEIIIWKEQKMFLQE